MRKKMKTEFQKDKAQLLDELSQPSLAGVRGGDTTEPSPEDDNDMRGHIIEIG